MTLEYSQISSEFISNDMIKDYRKSLQCFRHAKEISLKEYENYI